MVLLQIALKNTRRARRAWAWPRNQFWFESLLQGDFVENWWKESWPRFDEERHKIAPMYPRKQASGGSVMAPSYWRHV